MNLRSNKGFAVEDISIAVIIIMIFIPTVFGAMYNIQKTNAEIERKVQAIKIATDLLDSGSIKDDKYLTDNDFIYEDNTYTKIQTKSNVAYKITVTKDSTNSVKVNVEYPIGKDTNSIEVSKKYDE